MLIERRDGCMKENDEKIDLNKDFLLIESTKIVNDYINMNKKILLSERD